MTPLIADDQLVILQYLSSRFAPLDLQPQTLNAPPGKRTHHITVVLQQPGDDKPHLTAQTTFPALADLTAMLTPQLVHALASELLQRRRQAPQTTHSAPSS